MMYTAHDIARMIDISVLKFDTTIEQVDAMIAACKQYDIGCAFAMSCYSEYLGNALAATTTEFGTSLGFPSGQYCTASKVWEAEYFVSLGADQVDMVLNVGWLKSGLDKQVGADIAAVRKATETTSLKVIIEASLLSDDEIRRACAIVADCGADYVKSGTGFSSPTTLHHVAIMEEAIEGTSLKFKVAGGVRDLKTLLQMREHGVTRFGIGMPNTLSILQEALSFPDGVNLSIVSGGAGAGELY